MVRAGDICRKGAHTLGRNLVFWGQETAKGDAMQTFLSRFGENVIGTLSGFDRLVLRGVLRQLSHVGGMLAFLYHKKILLKNLTEYFKDTTNQIKARSEALALAFGLAKDANVSRVVDGRLHTQDASFLVVHLAAGRSTKRRSTARVTVCPSRLARSKRSAPKRQRNASSPPRVLKAQPTTSDSVA